MIDFHLHFPQDLVETRELLEEVLEGKQRVEEQLRLRERELTALKGALKEEVASRDQEVEHVRQQYTSGTQSSFAGACRMQPRHVTRAGLGKESTPREGGCLEVLVFGDFFMVITGTPPKRHT